MSSVPPNLVGPILQSNLAQRQVSGVRDNEEAQKTNANRRQAAALDATDTTVGTDDEDAQIHTDAEGTGSQGRSFTNPEEAEELEGEAAESDLPSDDEGHHIDLQA